MASMRRIMYTTDCCKGTHRFAQLLASFDKKLWFTAVLYICIVTSFKTDVSVRC